MAKINQKTGIDFNKEIKSLLKKMDGKKQAFIENLEHHRELLVYEIDKRNWRKNRKILVSN